MNDKNNSSAPSSDLHAAIMNLHCDASQAHGDPQTAYKYGHRDARHAAAELVAATEGTRPPAALPQGELTNEQKDAIKEAAKFAWAYGKEELHSTLQTILVTQPPAERAADVSVTNYGDAVDKSAERAQGEGLTDEQIFDIHDKTEVGSSAILSFARAVERAILASQTAPTRPKHETIVREGDNLVCTACGTTAPTLGYVAHLDEPSSLTASQTESDAVPTEVHSDDVAVDRFAAAMKDKMAKSRAKGRGGWDDPAQCGVQDLADMLVDHIEKGNPVDFGNFAMMLWNRGAWTGDLVSALSQYVMRESRDPQQQATVPEYLREFVDAVAHNYTVYDEESDETYCRGCSALIPYGDCYKTAHQPGCIVPRAQSMLAAAPSTAPAHPARLMKVAELLNRAANAIRDPAKCSANPAELDEAAASIYEVALAAQPVAQEGDQLDMRLPCDVTIGAVTIHKGCTLRTLVLRAQGLHRMLMERMPTPTPEQQAKFQALLTHGPDAQEGNALDNYLNASIAIDTATDNLYGQKEGSALDSVQGDLTTVDCPVCKGEGGFEESACGEGCCRAGVMCDECSGQGRIIVLRRDLDQQTSAQEGGAG